jgi:arginase family enzyme
LIHFYKRAQIVIADVWGAYGRPRDTSHPCYFHDLNEMTMFADYRVPQILCHMGILKYSSKLYDTVVREEEIPFGSTEEVEIRAATVIAVEKIRKRLQEVKSINILSIEVDWLLWNWGEKIKDTIIPHHRTLTVYY